MAKPLSYISHFYNHPLEVEQQLAYWDSLPDEMLDLIEFVLIDDSSKDLPTVAPKRAEVRYYRIEQDIAWNQSGARNLGAHVARGDWLLFADIDQHCYAPPLRQLLGNLQTLDPGALFHMRIAKLINVQSGRPLLFAPSTFLVQRDSFRVLGRYDEDFAGHYGFEDLYFHEVWRSHGGRHVVLDAHDYFEDCDFGTTGLDRDTVRNDLLSRVKIARGSKNAPGILRFTWHRVDLARPHN